MPIGSQHPQQQSRKVKWTEEAYNLLFQLAVEKFGPHKNWEMSHRPGHGLDEEYEEFKTRFSKTIDAESAEAVHLQIMAAAGLPKNSGEATRTIVSAGEVMRRAAAIRAGFID